MDIRIIILGCVFGLSACHSSEKKASADSADNLATMKLASDSNIITAAIDSSNNAKTASDWKGNYKGVLPCADCAGVVMEIMLHPDNTYMISTQYLGKKDSKGNMAEGKFIWIDEETIQLSDIKDQPSKYHIEKNKIVQLNIDGNKMTGMEEKYSLLKQ